jgi:hypothetical protein
MKKFLVTLGVIGVLILGFYALNNYIYQEKQGDAPVVSTESPTFTWRFENADTLNGDGNPNTNVFLDVKYSDGEVKSELIQVSHGSCNVLPDGKENNIQCYGAGFGFRFKIVKGEKSYLVMKQEFDEGSPDYNPPEQEYKAVKEIPFK